jgi:hypothetical protein
MNLIHYDENMGEQKVDINISQLVVAFSCPWKTGCPEGFSAAAAAVGHTYVGAQIVRVCHIWCMVSQWRRIELERVQLLNFFREI